MSVPLEIKAATWTGILDSNLMQLSAPCPTGNCTWPTTPSIAVCGACSNTTYQQSCDLTDQAISTKEREPLCHFKMPSGNIANLTDFGNQYATNEAAVILQVMPSPGAIYKQNDSNLYISNFEVVGSPSSPLFPATVPWTNSSTVASECALWICVQAFGSSTINANQTQVVIQDFSQIRNTTAIAQGHSSDPFTFHNLPSEMNPRPDANYTIGFMGWNAFQFYLGPMFNGSVSLWPASTKASSDVVEALWSSTGDLDKWINMVATSLTNAIRADKTDGNQDDNLEAKYDAFYDGQAYQLGYSVRWPWIILPTVLVVWSLIILATTMIKTARSPVRAWKGSPLAVLFMDVDDQIKKTAVGQLDIYNGLPKSVGGTKVKLEADQEGRWCFKRS